ncbi:diacylglycerol kinase family lipid kinase [soil metagenome]
MWLVLINPAAGRKPVEVAEVQAALSKASVEARIEVVETPLAMTQRIIELAGSGVREKIAVVGGDGTANLAANAILGTSWAVPPWLGVLPGGTGCDLLRTFAIPQSLAKAAFHLAGSSLYPIDVGRLEGAFGVRHFLNVAQVGVGAAAAEAAVGVSRAWGKARYPLAFLRRLPRFPFAQVTVTGSGSLASAPGRRGYEGPALAVILANGQYFAGGWNVAPRANLTDGKLDVQVINCQKREAFRLVPRIIRGVHLSDPAVQRFSKSTVEISAEPPWPLEADGELVGNTPVSVSVLRGALSLKI